MAGLKNGSRSVSRKREASDADLVEEMCNYIRGNATSGLSLAALEEKFSLSRYTLHRLFKQVMGITPRKYMEECRINLLKRNLREGEVMPNAVYRTGYNSHSWLYSDASSKLGMLPSTYRNGGKGAVVQYLTAECDLGHLLVAQTEHGICSLTIADSEDDLLKFIRREFPKAEIVRSESARPRLDSVIDYFHGQLLNLPVEVGGTSFQRRVWAAIRTIPYGETKTYNEIAELIGKPTAYRAVANACGANPVPLIVPCHRVVRKDGGLGGYGMGIDRKKYLLEMEKRNRASGGN